MWQAVPWFVAGGLHSPEVARLLAYAATGGGEGVVQAADCKVTELDVPAGSVNVQPGGVVILNDQPGGGSQSYVARNPAAEEVAITPTGSGGGRTDLLVVRIEDPQYPGTAEPVDPAVGPYTFSRVIEDVPADTTRLQDVAGHENDSGYALARITLPASTATVLDSHITDLRHLIQPRRESVLLTHQVTAEEVQTSEAAGGEQWPNTAGWNVVIPPWATRVKAACTWGGVRVPAGNVVGRLSLRLGLVGLADAPVTEEGIYDTPGSDNVARETWMVGDDIPVAESVRGTSVFVHPRARITSKSSDAARVKADGGTSVVVQLEFVEEPE